LICFWTIVKIYVAQIAFCTNDGHAVRAMLEADSYERRSLLVADCHCLAHGFDLRNGFEQQKKAAPSGIGRYTATIHGEKRRIKAVLA
jgi:hypothetical protein